MSPKRWHTARRARRELRSDPVGIQVVLDAGEEVHGGEQPLRAIDL